MIRSALILASIGFAVSALAQTITKVELTKDNGKGKPGQVVRGFAPADNPIHCVMHLKPAAGSPVFTGTLIAVNAGGVQNYKVATTNISSLPSMDALDFKFSLPRNWPTGSYRIELRSNGKSLKEITFEVN